MIAWQATATQIVLIYLSSKTSFCHANFASYFEIQDFLK